MGKMGKKAFLKSFLQIRTFFVTEWVLLQIGTFFITNWALFKDYYKMGLFYRMGFYNSPSY